MTRRQQQQQLQHLIAATTTTAAAAASATTELPKQQHASFTWLNVPNEAFVELHRGGLKHIKSHSLCVCVCVCV